MEWLPVSTAFQEDLQAAMLTRDGQERLERLVALARTRLDYLQTLQLDRALGTASTTATVGFTGLRLAILAASTVAHLVPAIRVACLRRRILLEVYTGAYNQHRQELLNEGAPLYTFQPDFVLVSFSPHDVVSSVAVGATSNEVDQTIDSFVSETSALWQLIRNRLDATVIQQTCLNLGEPLFGSHDRLIPSAPTQVLARLNDATAQAAAAQSVLLLDIARASEREGLRVWFDFTRWLQAKVEISYAAATMYGELVARLIAAQRGLSKKCLVLDLDNTLWGGVLGDDGLEGIVLGEGSAAGEAHLALQRYARRLRERGVILAVCSKNDPGLAETAFSDHPEMLLKRAEIAAFVANWDDKATNIERIAQQLNIGVDSLVFVDDNPAERARVRQSLPMVEVPELSEDPATYVRTLADAGYFDAVTFTSEDRQRTEQYAANAARHRLMSESTSLDAFLRGLDMTVICGPAASIDHARLAQLIGKTNQFNLTIRRRALQEIVALARDEQCMVFQFRLIDRFGDNGIVSAMILTPSQEEPGAMDIDTWVMSCRVFGRQLEIEALNYAVEQAKAKGVHTLYGVYVPSAKNGIVRDLYRTLGFVEVGSIALGTGASRWMLRLSSYAPPATHIARQEARHD